ncbi:hypothetical protein [Rothia dentocariosa]|nr:hypothetical protein [Rothia dentocariosa]
MENTSSTPIREDWTGEASPDSRSDPLRHRRPDRRPHKGWLYPHGY